MIIERFAPSPTGLLHLGHAYSASVAHHFSHKNGGKFLVRVEDIDTIRSKSKFTDAIHQDLSWLGLQYDQNCLHQSVRSPAYNSAIAQLTELGLTYPCDCTRKDIKISAGAGHGLPNVTEIYPNTCRNKSMTDMKKPYAIRLNIKKALTHLHLHGKTVGFYEVGISDSWHILDDALLQNQFGDIILARKDIGSSYHIAVTVDDAFQKVTHVTRGKDIFEQTHIHVLLQNLLGLSTPIYRHHRLILDKNNKRLAKRDDAKSIKHFRNEGYSPDDIFKLMEFEYPIQALLTQ